MKKYFFMLFFVLFALNAPAQNIKVVDGDSLEIDGKRIRLNGIDAPEYKQKCKNAAGKTYACGKKSMYYVEDFIADKYVDCRCLPEKDRYERELCECFVDGVSLNEALVSAGWAVAYRDNNYTKMEKVAREHKRGIWQGKNMRPALYRTLQRKREKQKSSPQTLF